MTCQRGLSPIYSPMPITKTEVEKVAHLARLELEPSELERLADDLTAIVAFVEKLSQIDTKGVTPRTQFVGVENVFRDDTPGESLTQAEALRNAPKKDESYFLVPRVIG